MPTTTATMSAADFGHTTDTITFRGRPCGALTPRGWAPVSTADGAVDRAVHAAIWGAPADIAPADLRRRITDDLGL